MVCAVWRAFLALTLSPSPHISGESLLRSSSASSGVTGVGEIRWSARLSPESRSIMEKRSVMGNVLS